MAMKDLIRHIQEGDILRVMLEIERGKSDNTYDVDTKMKLSGVITSPLLEATRVADFPIVESLLLLGADPNITDKEHATPLMYAVETEQPDIVEALLHHGADVSIRDKKGKSAVSKSSDYLDKTTLEMLLDASEAQGNISAIVGEVLETKDVNVLRVLHKRNIDILNTQVEGATLLEHACRTINLKLATFLIKSGANPDCVGEKNDSVCFILARIRYDLQYEAIDILKILHKHGHLSKYKIETLNLAEKAENYFIIKYLNNL